jgi:hypothetical protein
MVSAFMMAVWLSLQQSTAFTPLSSQRATVYRDRQRNRGGVVAFPYALQRNSSSSSDIIQEKLRSQMAKLQERDRKSKEILSDVSGKLTNLIQIYRRLNPSFVDVFQFTHLSHRLFLSYRVYFIVFRH